MAPVARLSMLADLIARETRKIEDYFAANGLPGLSFDADAPLDFPVPSSNIDIHAARRTVIDATKELHGLMVGPSESLRWLAWSYNDNLSLRAVYHFRIADAVPLEGETSFDHVAAAVSLDRVNVKRIVRHAMTNNLFCEPRPGYVAHTAMSRAMLEDPTLKDWVGLCSSDFFPAAARTVDAMEKWPGSQEPTHAGFAYAWNTDVPMFVEIGKDPARAKRFGRAMASLTGGEGYEVDYLVNGYPWADLGKATVVDVGGSHGFVPVALGAKFPDLRFIVQDLPKTVADGPAHIPAELADRIEFQAHDFFTEQPVHGADVYFFRWIFHNWSDKYCEKMLRMLIPALKPGARILINENILPTPGTENAWDEKIIRSMDMTMLQLLNARERAEEDYAELFQNTDPGFKFLGVKRPPGSRTCTIEAVWQPHDLSGHISQLSSLAATPIGSLAATPLGPFTPSESSVAADYGFNIVQLPSADNKGKAPAADAPLETFIPAPPSPAENVEHIENIDDAPFASSAGDTVPAIVAEHVDLVEDVHVHEGMAAEKSSLGVAAGSRPASSSDGMAQDAGAGASRGE
ncbi:uncharacterized protein K452DRAFT_335379 [Aplosporella prunicola CBS 121167]|uniref:Uncharacterized protein n=1 Tax=Aplosporella prunicola CBS 121167 TaxID=1176127 RepID=A0A6A6B9Q5_9PEZI|nr:uncharacterized protein K452DRAFT_335379 [Aplosporella prunicola CBS 121167]KAF2140298.1 hypothetical protein K452DRAFT_335379 [Aplosporella prunicola CBS 121167]